MVVIDAGTENNHPLCLRQGNVIKTAAQLKAKVRNLSGGDKQKAPMLICNFSGAIYNQLLLRIE
jgi:hypothetical protein